MSNISEYSHNYSHNGVNYLSFLCCYWKNINYIYRILHGTLNSASTSFLVDIIENLTFNEDGRLLFPDFLLQYLSDIHDFQRNVKAFFFLILKIQYLSQTIMSQQTLLLFEINQNQFPMEISINFLNRFYTLTIKSPTYDGRPDKVVNIFHFLVSLLIPRI